MAKTKSAIYSTFPKKIKNCQKLQVLLQKLKLYHHQTQILAKICQFFAALLDSYLIFEIFLQNFLVNTH